VFHARATTATIRAHLINLAARLARSARRLILRLPQSWPWQPAGKPCTPGSATQRNNPPPDR
jgi:hypothetical protein